MIHRVFFLSAALVLALFLLPAGLLAEEEAVPLSRLLPQTEEPEQSEPEETGKTAPVPEQAETQETEAPPVEAAPESATEEETVSAAEEPEEPDPLLPEALTLLLSDGRVETLEVEDYLWGVLAAEMPASFPPEALKAQAVAARSYAAYQLAHPGDRHPEADLCAEYTCCQAWISRADRLAQWPEEGREDYAQKITQAVEETQGQVLTWSGDAVLAVFHAASAGATRSAQEAWGTALPYLVSVESLEGEADTPSYYSVVSLAPEEFSALFLAAYPEADLSGDPSGWVTPGAAGENGQTASYTVGGVSVTAQELRTVCSLRSPSFQVEYQEGSLNFYVTGYGHGVGMSQYGASAMAQAGASYQEILAHYYPGTQLTG